MADLAISVRYRGFVEQSDATGLYVSWCPMLDIKSQGRSAEEARASLDDSVRLYVVHCFRRGILEEVLQRRGLQTREPGCAQPSSEDGIEHISIGPAQAAAILETWEGDVPLALVAAEKAARERSCPPQ